MTTILAVERPYLATGVVPALSFYVVLGVAMYTEYRISRGQPATDAQDRDKGSKRAVFAGLFLAYFAAFAVSFAVPGTAITGSARVPVFVLALIVAAAGQCLRVWSVRKLGSSFTYTVHAAPDQQVIDTGPYRFIRHPGYTGALLFVLGLTIALTNWLAPVMTVFAAVGFAIRIRVEEQALAETLGEPFRQYMRRTKRLIPFVL